MSSIMVAMMMLISQTYFDGIHNDPESVDRLVGSKSRSRIYLSTKADDRIQLSLCQYALAPPQQLLSLSERRIDLDTRSHSVVHHVNSMPHIDPADRRDIL
jgi:hypothetical protein